MAGAIIFVLEYASGAALIGALLSHGVKLEQAQACWGATFYAPCALLILASFNRSFRRIVVWLPLAIAFAAPSAASLWLSINRTDVAPDYGGLVFLVAISLWLTAIAYLLQRTRPKPGLSGETHSGEGRGRPAERLEPIMNELSAKLAVE